MIVYNITIKVTPAIEENWLEWQKTEHIPEMMATGLFVEYKLFRLLELEETDGSTYVIQYFTDSIEKYAIYIEEYAPALRKKAADKWADQFIGFRTVMEVVH